MRSRGGTDGRGRGVDIGGDPVQYLVGDPRQDPVYDLHGDRGRQWGREYDVDIMVGRGYENDVGWEGHLHGHDVEDYKLRAQEQYPHSQAEFTFELRSSTHIL